MENYNTTFPTILPDVIRGLIVSYLDEDDYTANQLRKECINITIKDIRNNCTYKNGALHSFNDYPAKILDTTKENKSNENNPDEQDEQNEQYYIKNIGQMINLLKSITTTIKKFIYKDGIKIIIYIETMITLLLYIIIQIMLLNI